MRAVLPVAGLGTRFLPVTKAVPKELLPILDRPCAEYVVLEALEAGLEELIFVTSEAKDALVACFRRAPQLETSLEAVGRTEALREVRRVAALATIIEARQSAPLGLGHAIWTAASHTGVDPLAVLLPDNIVDSETPAIGQVMAVHRETGGAVAGLEELPLAPTAHYGVCHGSWQDDRMQVADVVEKPAPGTAPGRHVFVGRYVLPPQIHDGLAATEPGRQGEVQLSDALAALAADGDLIGVPIEGRRLDTGTPLGLLHATLHLALRRADVADDVRALLARHLGP